MDTQKRIKEHRYTGVILPFATQFNVIPDSGVENTQPDMCHIEEHVTVQQIYQRLKNMKALSVADGEYEYDQATLNDDDLSEDIMSDELDTSDDVFEAQERVADYMAEKYSNLPAEKQAQSSEPLKADEQVPTSGETREEA